MYAPFYMYLLQLAKIRNWTNGKMVRPSKNNKTCKTGALRQNYKSDTPDSIKKHFMLTCKCLDRSVSFRPHFKQTGSTDDIKVQNQAARVFDSKPLLLSPLSRTFMSLFNCSSKIPNKGTNAKKKSKEKTLQYSQLQQSDSSCHVQRIFGLAFFLLKHQDS